MNREALLKRLRAAFLEDLEAQLRTVEAELLALEKDPAAGEPLKGLFRAFHTLKGGAQAAGLPLVASTTHALESLLSAAQESAGALGPAQFRLLFACADALREVAGRVRDGAPLEGTALERLQDAIGRGELEAAPESPAPADAVPSPPQAEASGETDPIVRVQAEKLDALESSVGQLIVLRAGGARRALDAQILHEAWADWTRGAFRTLREVGAAVERLGGAPALVHRLEALDGDLRELLRRDADLSGRLAGDARALGQVADEMVGRVRRARLRPFREATEPLRRTVRDVALRLGKEVELEVTGGEVEADRTVLDGVREAMLHLVRNAIDHGFESPDARAAGGKPRAGTLRVDAALRGQSLTVTVSDDGRGIDRDALRAARERQGLPPFADDRELVAALLAGGLSSREEVTPVSGRGVGLDAARAAIRRIRGTIDIAWRTGSGTTFTLICPLTLMTIRALLVRVSGQTFALPVSATPGLRLLDPQELRRVQGRDAMEDVGPPVPVVALAALLGPPLVAAAAVGRIPLVVLAANGRRLAVAVDELLVEQELVVRPLERARSALLGGAAILDTGEVALVLDAAAVVEAGHGMGASGLGTEEAAKSRARPRILVVDDSITTRALEQSTLEAAGYAVTTAVDGADAWRLLQEGEFDAVVSDVEMPRMDGFALCAAVRGSARLAALPLVLVTGLETEDHRARGLEAGADAYIGKSSFEQGHLIETLAQLVDA